MSITTAYIDNQEQLDKIKSLKTGDLVKFKADILPIIYHYGIVDVIDEDIFIIHNQTDFINKNGGNLLREDFRKYAKGRKIISVEKTGFNRDQLSEITEFLKDKKYHFINNNCEHFISQLKTNKFTSPQVIKWSLITVALIGISIVIKKR
jgi:hypothetical protein